MLDDEVQSVTLRVNSHLSDTVNTGLTMISDGWSNVQNRSIINFLSVTPEGAVFFGACDTSGEIKDAAYIASTFCEQLEKVEEHTTLFKLLQIVPATVSQPENSLLKNIRTHCLDLLLEDNR